MTRARPGARAVLAAGSFLAVVASSPAAGAQELRHDPRVDASVTIAGAAAYMASEAGIQASDPLSCHWCDRDAAGHDTLNAVDRAMRRLRWSDTHLADVLSNVTAFVVTPLIAGGMDAFAAHHDGRGDVGTDLLVITEATVLAADVNQLTKLLVRRERPDIHALAPEARDARAPDVEDDLSFDSGHTTVSVSLAVAAGTVASLRGYRLAPVVWASALPPALVTGYLRIGADRHYFTDVLSGAISGAAIGFLAPYLFHSPSSAASTGGAAGPAVRSASGPPPYLLGYSGAW